MQMEVITVKVNYNSLEQLHLHFTVQVNYSEMQKWNCMDEEKKPGGGNDVEDDGNGVRSQ